MLRGLVLGLLLLPLLPGTASAQSSSAAEEPWRQEDPADDVSAPGGATSAPPTPLTRYIDLRGVEIEDRDGSTLVVRIKTASGFSTSTQTISLFGTLRFEFQPPQTSSFARIEALVVPTSEGGEIKTYVGGVRACLVNPMNNQCWVEASLRPPRIESGVLEVEFPKDLLVASSKNYRFYGPKDLPPRLVAGEQIERIRLESRSLFTGASFTPDFRDVAPNAGTVWPPFKIRHSTALPDLRLNTSRTGLVAGEENLVAATLSNLAERKRLVNLSAQVSQSDEPGWQVAVTPLVTLASKSQTTILLRITPPATQRSASLASVAVIAKVVTEGGDTANTALRFYASPPLDSTRDRYFLHGASSPWDEPLATYWGVPGRISRMEQDPTYPGQVGIRMHPRSSLSTTNYEAYLYSADSIPNPVTVLAEPARLHLELQSQVAMTGRLRATVVLGGNGTPLLEFQRDAVTVGPTPTILDLEASVAAKIRRLDPSSGGLRLVVSLVTDQPGVTSAGFSANPTPKVLPRKSWLDFPFERDNSVLAAVRGPRVVLAAAEETDEFIHPGKQVVFEFDLRNEDSQERRVEVVLENASLPWTAKVLPGERYRLRPNESARIGVAIRAPADVKEGTGFAPIVKVRGLEDGLVYYQSKVFLTATASAKAEDENFTVDQEAAAKLDVAAKAASAAPGAVGFFLAAAIVAAVRGRRRA